MIKEAKLKEKEEFLVDIDFFAVLNSKNIYLLIA